MSYLLYKINACEKVLAYSCYEINVEEYSCYLFQLQKVVPGLPAEKCVGG